MNSFFFIVEVFIYVFVWYLFIYKKEIAVIYLPVIFFSYSLIISVLPVFVFYGVVGFLVIYLIIKQGFVLFRYNVYSLLLFIYFLVLLLQASSTIKYGLVYSVLLFFISLPLIHSVFKQNCRDFILEELQKSALIILIIFIINVIFASLTKYSVSMYGISHGVMFGKLTATDFNVVSVALFIVLLSILKKTNVYTFFIYVVAMSFILLTLRRSAMLVSLLAIPFGLILTFNQNTIKKGIAFFIVLGVAGTLVYFNTNFAASFRERYELRNLEDRAFEEEKRFSEYDMIYEDMFVIKAYSPLFGFQLFNSAGNYGRGVFSEVRTLHGDLASIAHSSGLLGVVLYLLMILTAFAKSFVAGFTKTDFIIFLYCLIVFVIYNITGRYTQTDIMILLFLLAQLSVAEKEMLNVSD